MIYFWKNFEEQLKEYNENMKEDYCKEEEEKKIKRLTDKCERGAYNFYFLPCASLDKNLNCPFYYYKDGRAVIQTVKIDGLEINKIDTNYGFAYRLKPGTYTLKVSFFIECRAYMYDANKEFQDSMDLEEKITIKEGQTHYFRLGYDLGLSGTVMYNRRTKIHHDCKIKEFNISYYFGESSLSKFKGLDRAWEGGIDKNYIHYLQPNFSKYAPKMNINSIKSSTISSSSSSSRSTSTSNSKPTSSIPSDLKSAMKSTSLMSQREKELSYKYGLDKVGYGTRKVLKGRYTGFFYEGTPHGYGKMITSSDEYNYAGMFANGVYNGYGILYTDDKTQYKFGYFENGKLKGKGISVLDYNTVKVVTVGNFVDGKFEGETYTYSFDTKNNIFTRSKDLFSSSGLPSNYFKEKLPISQRTIKYSYGTYRGDIFLNKPNGYGESIFNNGMRYFGEFSHGNMTGFGMLYFYGDVQLGFLTNGNASGNSFVVNGSYAYNGEKNNSKFVGEGICYSHKGTVEVVRWENGIMCKIK